MIDIQYFGNLYYYKILFKSSNVCFDQYERHQKRSFNNRCWIAGANGPILLSVPLEKGRLQTTPLKHIRISNGENWQKRHWRSILSSYNASPWFSHYSDSMAELYATSSEFLIDWNLACLDWTIRQLGVELPYQLSKENENAVSDRLVINEESEKNEIRYQQVFENKIGFLPGLSILDLLFCTGPKVSVAFLKANG